MSQAIQTYSKRFFPDRNTTYTAGEVITIRLPPSEVKLLEGKDSYLRFVVRLQGNIPCNVDPLGGGAHSLFEYIQVLSGDGSQILEELNGYGQWSGTHSYYQSSQGLKNKYNIFEGQVLQRTEGNLSNFYSSYYNPDHDAESLNGWDLAEEWRDVEVTLPIRMSGILHGDRSFPVYATDGLTLRLYLASNAQALTVAHLPHTVTRRDGQLGCPDVNDLRHSAAYQYPTDTTQGTNGIIPRDATKGPQGFCMAATNPNAITGAAAPGTVLDRLTVNYVSGAVVTSTVPGDFEDCENMSTNVDQNGVKQSGYGAGWGVGVVLDDGSLLDCGLVSQLEWDSPGQGLVEIQLNTPLNLLTGQDISGQSNASGGADAFNPVFFYVPQTAQCSYAINNVEFYATCVEPGDGYFAALDKQMNSSTGFSLDIRSFNITRNNMNANSSVEQHLIPLTAQRCRGLLLHPYRVIQSLTVSFYQPDPDFMHDYQFVIRDLNTPQLPVVTDRESQLGLNSWNALADDERIKMLRACKIEPMNELNPANRFVFGRRLALRGHSFNANEGTTRVTIRNGVEQTQGGAPVQIQARYNKQLLGFSSHFRTIQCTPDQINVIF